VFLPADHDPKVGVLMAHSSPPCRSRRGRVEKMSRIDAQNVLQLGINAVLLGALGPICL